MAYTFSKSFHSPSSVSTSWENPKSSMGVSIGTTDNGTKLMDATSTTFEKGYYLPSDNPGFGTELTEKLVKEHAIA